MSHGAAAWFAGGFFLPATVLYFAALWRWRAAYLATPDAAAARRALLGMAGMSALFLALWLTCGRVAFAFAELRFAIPPLTLAGFGALFLSGSPRT